MVDDRRDSEPPSWRETAAAAAETREIRQRRLRIRCWRRGTKEMDLILGGFFDAEGASLSDADLDAFEALTREDDAALYRWISGVEAPPTAHAMMVRRLVDSREARTKK